MSTLHKLSGAVHRLVTKHIPKSKSRRFRCGVAALSLTEFVSLNAAGRRSNPNRWTGESKIRRTVTDSSLTDRVQRLLLVEAFTSRTGYWYCSLDHSQFGPFCIAVLAVSNRAGRAIPVWCQVNESEAALIAPLLAALEELFTTVAKIAPNLKLVLVMDRWFAADKLFTLITSHQCYFIARTKSDKKVVTPWDQYWQRSPIREITSSHSTAKEQASHSPLPKNQPTVFCWRSNHL